MIIFDVRNAWIRDGPLPWSSVVLLIRLILRRCSGVMTERAMTSPTASPNAVICSEHKNNKISCESIRQKRFVDFRNLASALHDTVYNFYII